MSLLDVSTSDVNRSKIVRIKPYLCGNYNKIYKYKKITTWIAASALWPEHVCFCLFYICESHRFVFYTDWIVTFCVKKRGKKKRNVEVKCGNNWILILWNTTCFFLDLKRNSVQLFFLFFYLFVCFYNNSNIFSSGRRFLTDVISLFPQTVKVKNDRKFVLFSFLWGLTFFRFLALQKKNNDIYVASRLIFSVLKCLQTSSEE